MSERAVDGSNGCGRTRSWIRALVERVTKRARFLRAADDKKHIRGVGQNRQGERQTRRRFGGSPAVRGWLWRV